MENGCNGGEGLLEPESCGVDEDGDTTMTIPRQNDSQSQLREATIANAIEFINDLILGDGSWIPQSDDADAFVFNGVTRDDFEEAISSLNYFTAPTIGTEASSSSSVIKGSQLHEDARSSSERSNTENGSPTSHSSSPMPSPEISFCSIDASPPHDYEEACTFIKGDNSETSSPVQRSKSPHPDFLKCKFLIGGRTSTDDDDETSTSSEGSHSETRSSVQRSSSLSRVVSPENSSSSVNASMLHGDDEVSTSSKGSLSETSSPVQCSSSPHPVLFPDYLLMGGRGLISTDDEDEEEASTSSKRRCSESDSSVPCSSSSPASSPGIPASPMVQQDVGTSAVCRKAIYSADETIAMFQFLSNYGYMLYMYGKKVCQLMSHLKIVNRSFFSILGHIRRMTSSEKLQSIIGERLHKEVLDAKATIQSRPRTHQLTRQEIDNTFGIQL